MFPVVSLTPQYVAQHWHIHIFWWRNIKIWISRWKAIYSWILPSLLIIPSYFQLHGYSLMKSNIRKVFVIFSRGKVGEGGAMILWFMIISIYLVWSPFLPQSSLNSWNFLSDKNYTDVFAYVNEVTFQLHQGWGWLLGDFSPTPHLQVEERGWRLNQSPVTSDFN